MPERRGHIWNHFLPNNAPRERAALTQFLRERLIQRGRQGQLTSVFPAGIDENGVLAKLKSAGGARLLQAETGPRGVHSSFQHELELEYLNERGERIRGRFTVTVVIDRFLGEVVTLFPERGPGVIRVDLTSP